MVEIKTFKLFQFEQLLAYNKNSLRIFLIFLKDENNNFEDIIKDNEKDI